MSLVGGPDMRWFREARFGLFVHWGLYAIPAGRWNEETVPGPSEWIAHRARIPQAAYAKLADSFNPTAFDADRWARLARDAGMRYLVITAKHHDGFAMFRSSHPYNVADATPFGRDPMAELAEACQRYGLRLGFYYSQDLDWEADGGSMKWEEAGPEGGFVPVAPERFRAYLEHKVKPQLRELLTQYGPVALIWFDLPASITPEQSAELRALVHEWQPECLVSGRVGHNVGDYGSLGDNALPEGAVAGDWETPATINDSWGYKADDENWKSTGELIRQLTHCASKGVNLLLNVGPDAKGRIPDASADRLERVGAWLKTHGESVYGTAASPWGTTGPSGRVTARPGRLYLHLFEWPPGELTIDGLRNEVLAVHLLSDQRRSVDFAVDRNRAADRHCLRLGLPDEALEGPVPVVAIDIAGVADVT